MNRDENNGCDECSHISMISHTYMIKLHTAKVSTSSPLVGYIQWTLDYPDLDYPDPRLSGSRTEIIARTYNDLCMRVVAVDKKLLYTWLLNQFFCQLKIIRLLTIKAVYHSAPPVARSSWLFSPCSQQLVSAYGP